MSDKVTLTKEELVSLVGEAASIKAAEIVEAKVKELGLDQASNKFVKAGKDAESIGKQEGKQKTATFIKALYNKDAATLSIFKAMSEGTGSAGGFIVPEEFAAEVNRVVEDFGLVAKLARKIPMKSDTLNIPRLSASVTVSYPGENTSGTGSQPTLQQVQLLSKTLVGITPMSNELLEDADVDVVDLLVELFAEAIAGEIDNQAFNGVGSPFTGILTDSGVTVVTAATGGSTFALAGTPDNCRDLISNVKPWALQGAAYFMHRLNWAIIQKTKASTGGDYFASAANPILSGNAAAGYPTAIAGTLWGYPVYLSDKLVSTTAVSTKFIVFGNLKHVYLGVRKEMGILISEHATVGSDNLFAANMSAVRVTTRHAIAVGLPSAFACLKTSAS